MARRRAHQGGIAERKTMIDSDHKLPIKRQAIVLESLDDYGRSLLHRGRG
jgi:hypothetical protein